MYFKVVEFYTDKKYDFFIGIKLTGWTNSN